MARKLLKFTRSKGERLGWTPLDQVKYVTLNLVTIHGRKLTVRQQNDQQTNDTTKPQFRIP